MALHYIRIYIFISTLLLLVGSLIWSKTSWNVLIKIVLFLSGIMGIVCWLMAMGWVVPR